AARQAASGNGDLPTNSLKILGAELDRRAVRCAVGRVIPGVAIARECVRAGDPLGGHELLERGEPVTIIRCAQIGITSGLRAVDLLGQSRRPFGPGENAALMEG